MKKLLTMVLAVALVMTMSVTAFAAGLGDSTGDVHVTVQAYTQDVYAINFTWDNLTFTYAFDGWDEDNLEYTGGWTKDTANIVITNNSNVAVTATPKDPIDAVAQDDVTISVTDKSTKTLGIGDSCEFEVKAIGTPANEAKTYIAARIPVTIAKA